MRKKTSGGDKGNRLYYCQLKYGGDFKTTNLFIFFFDINKRIRPEKKKQYQEEVKSFFFTYYLRTKEKPEM